MRINLIIVRRALRSTNLKFELKPYNKYITDQELLDDLRRVASELGTNKVRYEQYPQYGRCASRVFETRFGSWNEALAAAGLQVTQRVNIPELELFENLERVWRTLGRQPRRQEMRRPLSEFSGGTYAGRFGGWRAALEAFVSFANSAADDPQEVLGNPGHGLKTPRFPDLRLRFRVLSRDSFKCQACGRSPATEHGVQLHVDHVIPWSLGGSTTAENLRTLCERCNIGKGDMVDGDV
ncbi:MAG: homing endonuclease associated repeat-containing protein [Desulfomonilaceae bacterium]